MFNEVMELKTPHIELGISVDEGIEILRSISFDIEKNVEEREDFYRASSENFEFGFYARGGVIHSSWYDDPLGRDSEAGINEKIMLYLSRYGSLNAWERGINNGWIQFFSNQKTNIGMSYGLHKDVLRFNYFG